VSFYSELDQAQLDLALTILRLCSESPRFPEMAQRFLQALPAGDVKTFLKDARDDYLSGGSRQKAELNVSDLLSAWIDSPEEQQGVGEIPVRIAQVAEALQILADRPELSLSVDADGEGVAIQIGDGNVLEV